MKNTVTITLVGSTKYIKGFRQIYEGFQDINFVSSKLFHTFPRIAVHQPSIYSHAIGINLTEEEEMECVKQFEKYIDESDLVIAMANVTPEQYDKFREMDDSTIIPISRDKLGSCQDLPNAVGKHYPHLIYLPFGDHTMLDLEYARSKNVKILYRTFIADDTEDLAPDIRLVEWNCQNMMTRKNFFEFLFDYE